MLWQAFYLKRALIHADRTDNWWLQLYTIKQMLPYFHAAGHLPYAKSAHLHVHQMIELRTIMPEEAYDQFTKQ